MDKWGVRLQQWIYSECIQIFWRRNGQKEQILCKHTSHAICWYYRRWRTRLSTFSELWDFIFNYNSLYPFVWVTHFYVILKQLSDLSFNFALYSPKLAHSVQENKNLLLIWTEFRTTLKPQMQFLLSFQTVCHRIGEPGSNFWRLSSPAILLRPESPTAGCSGPSLVMFWISARMETQPPHWATCSSVWWPTKQ